MSKFKSFSPEEIEALQSEFLIDSWSYSKVSAFSRNEKAFEMSYIYGHRSRNSATSEAGSAYHKALDSYFTGKQKGHSPLSLPELEVIAFDYIDNVPANIWKIQKTTPTVEDCKKKANSTVTALLKNFYAEKGLYEDEIDEILFVEQYFDEWVAINGVDIPMPCHAMIDLCFRKKDGSIVIVDHKSKSSYTDDAEIALSIGQQAITYIKVFEAATSLEVNEVWFVENKHSQNKDGSNQLVPFKVFLNQDTRRLYEALLYEPLKRMLEAVNNPDYVYLINNADNYVDMSELYNFWAKTMIAEVEEFNVADAKKYLISQRLRKIRDVSVATINPKIIKEFKENASQFIQYDLTNTNMTKEEKIEHVLRTFGKTVRVAHTFDGYSSNTYLLEVSAGVKTTSIHSHKLDIANALDVPNVRISNNLVVFDGKSYLAVELAKKRDRTLFFDEKEQIGWKMPLGKDNFNNTVYWDLTNHSTPHALVCGQTGSGKSVLVKNVIEYAKIAKVNEIIILDPKFEFVGYTGNNVQVYNDIIDIEEQMRLLVEEMNHRVKHNLTARKTLIIFDEFADAMAQSRKGAELDVYEIQMTGSYASGMPKMGKQFVRTDKSLEENMRVLLQKGRSTGFRIMAATQRASVKVITGDAKVNFPVQICFRVPKETDSRVVLDEPGAESLAGMGDGLIKSPEYPDTIRFQAFYKPESVTA